MVALYCTDFTKSLANKFTCTHKPIRGGHGITSVIYDPKEPMKELWVEVKLYFKPSLSIVFHPWQLDLQFDWCRRMREGGTINLLADTVIDYGLKKYAPTLFVKCPIFGERGIYNVDLASIMEAAVPQIVPNGIYKQSIRLFMKSSNITYFTAWMFGELRAVDVIKTWDFGK